MDKLYTLLDEMQVYANNHRVPIIGSESGHLLQKTAAFAKPVSVLEVGTAIGYSTLLLLANLAPGGRITTIEQDEQRALTAQQFWTRANVLDQIELIIGDAGEILPKLAGPFDLVFIDAAKGQYLDYLHKVMDKLCPGAIVIADNVLFRGYVLDDQVPPRRFRTIVKRLREYLNFVTNDARFTTVIHPIGDGIAVSQYRGETN